ncbi:MAG: MmcB family DNA repair protein [Pseudomonadota bacterium]
MEQIAPHELPGFSEAGIRPEVTSQLTRGVARLLMDMGCAVLTEMRLANGRRADLMGICPKGTLTLIEVKSCQADFDVDRKWPDYLDWADRFYFAVDEDFPHHLLPQEEGMIIADGFGGEIIRESQDRKLNAARRKAVTLRFARQAAFSTFNTAY